jgi:hypothetical protein
VILVRESDISGPGEMFKGTTPTTESFRPTGGTLNPVINVKRPVTHRLLRYKTLSNISDLLCVEAHEPMARVEVAVRRDSDVRAPSSTRIRSIKAEEHNSHHSLERLHQAYLATLE